MRLLEKYKTVEDVGLYERHRYSKKAQEYCNYRCSQAKTRKYELFWLNVHYVYGLMLEKNPRRYS